MISESRRGGDLNRAAGRDFDGWVDDILFPIPFAGGDIAWQRVAGQGRDRDVMSPADAALEHTPTPDRDIASQAQSLDLSSAGVAADATHLDVDDARGTEVQSGFRIADVTDRLVEAQRGFQMSLKSCVIGDVIPPERLFHHQ